MSETQIGQGLFCAPDKPACPGSASVAASIRFTTVAASVRLTTQDVCLEFKKLLTSYEDMQLAKALEELEGSDSEVTGLVQSVRAMDWSGLQAKLGSPKVAELDVKALASACKKQDTGAATKAVIKLAKGV